MSKHSYVTLKAFLAQLEPVVAKFNAERIPINLRFEGCRKIKFTSYNDQTVEEVSESSDWNAVSITEAKSSLTDDKAVAENNAFLAKVKALLAKDSKSSDALVYMVRGLARHPLATITPRLTLDVKTDDRWFYETTLNPFVSLKQFVEMLNTTAVTKLTTELLEKQLPQQPRGTALYFANNKWYLEDAFFNAFPVARPTLNWQSIFDVELVRELLVYRYRQVDTTTLKPVPGIADHSYMADHPDPVIRSLAISVIPGGMKILAGRIENGKVIKPTADDIVKAKTVNLQVLSAY